MSDPRTEIVLFHHVHGLTPGVVAFADRLREAGHTVHTPDLYGGRTFDTLEEGMAYGDSQDLDPIAAAAVADLPADAVLGGWSAGVAQAQKLLPTRPSARGAICLHAFVAPEWVGPWPDGVAAQVHGAEHDPFFADEGDLAAARSAAEAHPEIEVFVYPGEEHLFTDSSLAAYDAAATEQVVGRVLEFLGRL